MSDKKTKKTAQLNQEEEKLKQELADCNGKYLRALADYQNFEKRVRDEKMELISEANKHFIIKLLPFLDNLNKAEVFFQDAGLKMIKNELLEILKNEGVETIDIQGKEFDPHIAEAVDVAPGEKDNIVLEVVQEGYTLNSKILRVAQVKVSKKTENNV